MEGGSLLKVFICVCTGSITVSRLGMEDKRPYIIRIGCGKLRGGKNGAFKVDVCEEEARYGGYDRIVLVGDHTVQ